MLKARETFGPSSLISVIDCDSGSSCEALPLFRITEGRSRMVGEVGFVEPLPFYFFIRMRRNPEPLSFYYRRRGKPTTSLKISLSLAALWFLVSNKYTTETRDHPAKPYHYLELQKGEAGWSGRWDLLSRSPFIFLFVCGEIPRLSR
jgi:hypothetical protein